MKKKVMLIVTIIVLILIVTFGASVALFNGVRTGSSLSSIKVGDLTFKYTEVTGIGNGISLDDADAISDAEGKRLTTWFDFKIDANLVNNDMIYEVSVEPTNESTINLDGVKIYLTELVGNEEVDINSNYNGLGKVKVISDYNNGILYQERILKNTKNYEKNFRVRIWISEDVDIYTDGYMGTKGIFKINVNARSDISMVDASIPVPEITGGTGNNTSLKSVTISVLDFNPAIYGIDHYEYYITEDLEDIPNDLTIKTGDTDNQLLINTDGIKYIYYRSVTKNNEKSAWSNMQKVNKKSIWDFEFDPDGDGKGQIQQFLAPSSGNYKLEVWGAQGGGAQPGYGGYSTSNIALNNNTLYIAVGGAGAISSSSNNGGGYNGGGHGTNLNQPGSGGGGATHIAMDSGVLSSLSAHKNDGRIVIVAGGGGGSTATLAGEIYGYGGSGGGYIGVTGGYYHNSNWSFYGTGGSQTSGGVCYLYGSSLSDSGSFGSFGQGGNHGYESGRDVGGSGGGGGYYGGGGASRSHAQAGGGSGYIGSSLLIQNVSNNIVNKMYCYKCAESSDLKTYTISTYGSTTHDAERDTDNCTSGYSQNPVSKCAKAGNGHARITYISD